MLDFKETGVDWFDIQSIVPSPLQDLYPQVLHD